MANARAHWESDQWDDHVAGGSRFGLGALTVKGGPTQQQAAAAGLAQYEAFRAQAAAQPEHLNFLQKLLHFIAHPIKTTRAALHPQSGMHGYPPGLSTPAPGKKADWYEQQYDSLDWSR